MIANYFDLQMNPDNAILKAGQSRPDPPKPVVKQARLDFVMTLK